ncbi:hypothetical protein ACMFMG_007839 [Clarireedia jacksonii]
MSSASSGKRYDRTRNRKKKGQRWKQPSPPASRLWKVLNERSNDHTAVLERLIKTLEDCEVPGPQLFRLESEFSTPLGEGGDGNVRCVNEKSADLFRKDKRIRARWRFDLIAIKQHQRSTDIRQIPSRRTRLQPGVPPEPDRRTLADRFRAAECEVLALSPEIFRGHPNIVQLKGWGLCLDTIEQKGSTCCGPLQMPLLILERAPMNFTQFLQRSFSGRTREQDPESGGLNQPEWHHGAEFRRKESFWSHLANWIGVGEDQYETVRLLCIDVGHGLQALHDNKFTHGDLKPDNILIFRKGPKWTAKLCDFGCARGQENKNSVIETDKNTDQNTDIFKDITTPAKPRSEPHAKESYRGTDGWLPPMSEADDTHDYEGLRRCDIYVYGLVVWSAFYLRGEPPEHPNIENAKQISEMFRERWKWFPGSRQWLTDKIDAVFEGTLEDKERRTTAPWQNLYTSHTKATRYLVNSHISTPQAPRSDNRLTKFSISTEANSIVTSHLPVQPPLTLDMKSEYVRREWWTGNSVTDAIVPDESSKAPTRNLTESTASSQILKSTQHKTSRGPESYSGDNPEDDSEDRISNFVSSAPLALDDNLFSNDLFQGQKRRGDVHILYQEFLMNLSIWPEEGSPTNLYCLARFRSRIPLEWWIKSEPKENIVERALQVYPAVDICTLAWLCNGPIGGLEVRILSGNNDTWKIIASSDFLNESQRLERFLLLLQFGVRVEQHLDTGSGGLNRTILTQYIRNCRPATYPVIIKEICRRINRILNMERTATSTKDYLTINAAKDLGRINNTLPDLWNQFINQSTDVGASENAHERIPLIQNSPLLPGWKKHTISQGKGATTEWYEDEYTHSITLKEPKISLIGLRQVKIGFLDPKMGSSCYLDLAPYMMPGMDIQSDRGLDGDATDRFPYYDDDWFAHEWRTIPPHKDVLKDLREITSFTIRIPELGIWDFLVGAVEWGIEGLRIIFSLLWVVIKILLVLLAIISCVLLFVGLVWVLMPALLLAGNVLFIFTILMVCFLWTAYDSSGHRDDDRAHAFLFISITISVAAGIAMLIWEIRNPCPGSSDKGTWKNGDECVVCPEFIWNYLGCTPLKDRKSSG